MEPRLRGLLDTGYPQFGQSEMERRRRLLATAAEETGLDHVLIREAGRAGSAVQWLTGWPVTHEAVVVVTPGEQPTLIVDHYNHLPMAERLAVDCDVVWGERRALEVAVAALGRRARGRGRIGVIGAMSTGQHERLSDHASAIHDLNAAYTRLRLVKSAEEIDWLRIGAHLTDLGLDSLVRGLRLGESEHQLADHVERGYVPHGGATLIHFFGIASMAEPDCCVPRQFTSNRALRRGDVLFTEISGQFWFHPGQVLRTFYIGQDPPALFRELSEVAAAAFDAVADVLRPGARPEQVVEAASLIEDAGFSVWDDLMHGFGGGYLPPVIGTRSRPAGPLPDLTFEAGMTVVLQPNVVTRDGRAGVQTGEMLLITEDGCESLHHAPLGFVRLDPPE